MARMLYLESGDGRWIVRMTAGGEVFYAPDHMVNVGVTEKPTLPLHVRNHPRDRVSDVLQLFPRSRKG